MVDEYSGKDKRQFLRHDYDKTINFKTLSSSKRQDLSSDYTKATSKNLSASGILFVTTVKRVPNISSILALDLDHRTANICQEVEDQAVIVNDKVLGKVVRIEDNDDGTCGVGVAFLKKKSSLAKDLEDLLK